MSDQRGFIVHQAYRDEGRGVYHEIILRVLQELVVMVFMVYFHCSGLLESLCFSLYDVLRPIIIKINHLETLAELCSILNVCMSVPVFVCLYVCVCVRAYVHACGPV